MKTEVQGLTFLGCSTMHGMKSLLSLSLPPHMKACEAIPLVNKVIDCCYNSITMIFVFHAIHGTPTLFGKTMKVAS